MSQVIGNPNRGTGGHMVGGAGIYDLIGPTNPNNIADGTDQNVGVVQAGIGSTFRNVNGTAGSIFWVKVGMPNVWTAIA